MGWWSNKGVAKGTTREGVKTIKLSQISGGHSPDENRVKRWTGRCPAITVERSGGGYRLVDGVSRVTSARRAGARTIRAEVWS